MLKIPLRYEMNMGVLNQEELNKLSHIKVAIIGLGGLGGNVANQLLRLGVKHMILVDYDCFDESNLNRQLFSAMDNIGKFKVDIIADSLKLIDPNINLKLYKEKIQEVCDFKADYIIDCVDNIKSKIYLSKLSSKLNIPVLHGSSGGWYGQVGWMSPKCTLIEDMYGEAKSGLEEKMLNPPFTVSIVASYMVCEFTKMIKNSSQIVLDELLLIDLLDYSVLRTGANKNG